ncbi:Solute carrier family 43 member 3 [Chionoecetes opilio]|uniref:Solute carrier family 43 member 3 n=1 Tax=Chionoecetes opilio TaxID=41210 RepID=A0A8J4Y279_CHIOP|nr:Solute carrier family 43 member 3 [Chionoecetes opilio]
MPCQQSPHLELSLGRRVLIFAVGVVEALFFAGTVFGWPQLVHVLKVEGLYGDMCDGPSSLSPPPDSPSPHSSLSSSNLTSPLNVTALLGPESSPIGIFNNTRCNAFNHTYDISRSHGVSMTFRNGIIEVGVEQCGPQDERFALIFTITVSCYSLPGIFVGYLLHHAGLRVTRISGGTMMAVSFLLLGLTTKESPDWLFAAMVLMALGGNQLRMAMMQFCDLFPDHRSTGLTLLSGAYAVSAALFLVFQYSAAVGVARAHVCWGFATLCLVTTLTTFIMPVHHIPVKDTYGKDEAQPKKTSLPLTKSLCSSSSILHQYFFFVSLFAVNGYQQNYNVWVNLSSCTVEEAGIYSMLYSYSNLFTVFLRALGGAFTDLMVRRAQSTPDDISRRVRR